MAQQVRAICHQYDDDLSLIVLIHRIDFHKPSSDLHTASQVGSKNAQRVVPKPFGLEPFILRNY